MTFANKKFLSNESKITDGQMTMVIYKCCNSTNDVEFKTHDSKNT